MGLCDADGTSSVGWGLFDLPSGLEMGRIVVIVFNGVLGGGGAVDSIDEPPDIRRPALDSGESILADRPWLTALCTFMRLSLRVATILLADCPRPCGCGRVTTGE
jgi:hypothetical protein